MLDTNHPTGTQINYLVVCPRKLWLFSHGIEMERENEDVQMGKQIGEAAYGREKKEINLDNQIVLDWADAKPGANGVLTIHEIKKSKAVSRAHRLQMLFY
ncbi:MAG: Dna2/Cas4 domain-containing protein, partial [Proteobacteria bacterium]